MQPLARSETSHPAKSPKDDQNQHPHPASEERLRLHVRDALHLFAPIRGDRGEHLISKYRMSGTAARVQRTPGLQKVVQLSGFVQSGASDSTQSWILAQMFHRQTENRFKMNRLLAKIRGATDELT